MTNPGPGRPSNPLRKRLLPLHGFDNDVDESSSPDESSYNCSEPGVESPVRQRNESDYHDDDDDEYETANEEEEEEEEEPNNEEQPRAELPAITRPEQKEEEKKSEEEKRELFELEKNETLSSLPQSVRDLFGQVGFVKQGRAFIPCLVVSPYDVKEELRRPWKSKYLLRQRTNAPLDDLPLIIFWYGTRLAEEAFELTDPSKFETYEEGVENGHHIMPPYLEEKLARGCKLDKREKFRISGLQDLERERKLSPETRRKLCITFTDYSHGPPNDFAEWHMSRAERRKAWGLSFSDDGDDVASSCSGSGSSGVDSVGGSSESIDDEAAQIKPQVSNATPVQVHVDFDKAVIENGSKAAARQTSQIVDVQVQKKRGSRVNQAKWDNHYAQLVKFHQKNGHFKLKRENDVKLLNWLNNQRASLAKKIKDKALTGADTYRLEKLKQIGLDWKILKTQQVASSRGKVMPIGLKSKKNPLVIRIPREKFPNARGDKFMSKHSAIKGQQESRSDSSQSESSDEDDRSEGSPIARKKSQSAQTPGKASEKNAEDPVNDVLPKKTKAVLPNAKPQLQSSIAARGPKAKGGARKLQRKKQRPLVSEGSMVQDGSIRKSAASVGRKRKHSATTSSEGTVASDGFSPKKKTATGKNSGDDCGMRKSVVLRGKSTTIVSKAKNNSQKASRRSVSEGDTSLEATNGSTSSSQSRNIGNEHPKPPPHEQLQEHLNSGKAIGRKPPPHVRLQERLNSEKAAGSKLKNSLSDPKTGPEHENADDESPPIGHINLEIGTSASDLTARDDTEHGGRVRGRKVRGVAGKRDQPHTTVVPVAVLQPPRFNVHQFRLPHDGCAAQQLKDGTFREPSFRPQGVTADMVWDKIKGEWIGKPCPPALKETTRNFERSKARVTSRPNAPDTLAMIQQRIGRPYHEIQQLDPMSTPGKRQDNSYIRPEEPAPSGYSWDEVIGKWIPLPPVNLLVSLDSMTPADIKLLGGKGTQRSDLDPNLLSPGLSSHRSIDSDEARMANQVAIGLHDGVVPKVIVEGGLRVCGGSSGYTNPRDPQWTYLGSPRDGESLPSISSPALHSRTDHLSVDWLSAQNTNLSQEGCHNAAKQAHSPLLRKPCDQPGIQEDLSQSKPSRCIVEHAKSCSPSQQVRDGSAETRNALNRSEPTNYDAPGPLDRGEVGQGIAARGWESTLSHEGNAGNDVRDLTIPGLCDASGGTTLTNHDAGNGALSLRPRDNSINTGFGLAPSRIVGNSESTAGSHAKSGSSKDKENGVKAASTIDARSSSPSATQAVKNTIREADAESSESRMPSTVATTVSDDTRDTVVARQDTQAKQREERVQVAQNNLVVEEGSVSAGSSKQKAFCSTPDLGEGSDVATSVDGPCCLKDPTDENDTSDKESRGAPVHDPEVASPTLLSNEAASASTTDGVRESAALAMKGTKAGFASIGKENTAESKAASTPISRGKGADGKPSQSKEKPIDAVPKMLEAAAKSPCTTSDVTALEPQAPDPAAKSLKRKGPNPQCSSEDGDAKKLKTCDGEAGGHGASNISTESKDDDRTKSAALMSDSINSTLVSLPNNSSHRTSLSNPSGDQECATSPCEGNAALSFENSRAASTKRSDDVINTLDGDKSDRSVLGTSTDAVILFEDADRSREDPAIAVPFGKSPTDPDIENLAPPDIQAGASAVNGSNSIPSRDSGNENSRMPAGELSYITSWTGRLRNEKAKSLTPMTSKPCRKVPSKRKVKGLQKAVATPPPPNVHSQEAPPPANVQEQKVPPPANVSVSVSLESGVRKGFDIISQISAQPSETSRKPVNTSSPPFPGSRRKSKPPRKLMGDSSPSALDSLAERIEEAGANSGRLSERADQQSALPGSDASSAVPHQPSPGETKKRSSPRNSNKLQMKGQAGETSQKCLDTSLLSPDGHFDAPETSGAVPHQPSTGGKHKRRSPRIRDNSHMKGQSGGTSKKCLDTSSTSPDVHFDAQETSGAVPHQSLPGGKTRRRSRRTQSKAQVAETSRKRANTSSPTLLESQPATHPEKPQKRAKTSPSAPLDSLGEHKQDVGASLGLLSQRAEEQVTDVEEDKHGSSRAARKQPSRTKRSTRQVVKETATKPSMRTRSSQLAGKESTKKVGSRSHSNAKKSSRRIGMKQHQMNKLVVPQEKQSNLTNSSSRRLRFLSNVGAQEMPDASEVARPAVTEPTNDPSPVQPDPVVAEPAPSPAVPVDPSPVQPDPVVAEPAARAPEPAVPVEAARQPLCIPITADPIPSGVRSRSTPLPHRWIFDEPRVGGNVLEVDYVLEPHRRDKCVVKLFQKRYQGSFEDVTLHNEQCCNFCVCFVCGVKASLCDQWTHHCNATDTDAGVAGVWLDAKRAVEFAKSRAAKPSK